MNRLVEVWNESIIYPRLRGCFAFKMAASKDDYYYQTLKNEKTPALQARNVIKIVETVLLTTFKITAREGFTVKLQTEG